MIDLAMRIFGSWKQWVLFAVAIVGLLGWLAVEKIRTANLRADLAASHARIEALSRDVTECTAANKGFQETLRLVRLNHQASLDAAVRDLTRQLEEAKKLPMIKEKIRVQATQCPAASPADQSLLDWLRQNPDAEYRRPN